jgi:DNA-binding NtrC family response regulator
MACGDVQPEIVPHVAGRGTALPIVGRSPALLAALDTARRLAATSLPILIVGETGTGKELIARYVHQASGRQGPLVDVDCGALPDDLMEALLFGHRRGAFTGAVDHHEGIIENADGGTLFLDELGSLPLRGQAKLLRVLETGEIRRVGATRTRSVDVRVVSTMQEDASKLLADGLFRPDLMQRVAGAVIRVPPLSERPDDVVPLARHFSASSNRRLEPDAEALLCDRPWPGNVRELRWTIERAALFAVDGGIGSAAVAEALEIGPGMLLGEQSAPRNGRITELRAACRRYRGDADRVAAALGIGRSTLYRWLREARLELRTFKERVVS